MRHALTWLAAASLAASLAPAALADTVKASVALATPAGPGARVGMVTFTDSPKGAVIRVMLKGLPAGPHGFHVHANPDCGASVTAGKPPVPAGAAGGHFDPAMAKMHMGPGGAGHLGDLPRLTIAANGSDYETLLAPHITHVSALHGRSVMIHAGGDNYSDVPKPVGGGGPRLACGVIG